MKFKKLFKKFGGEYIPDIVEYLRLCLEKDPKLTITIGCDSVQKRRKTVYAITIMLYNGDIKNGAHVVFFRDSCDKVKDNQERLYKEAQYLYDIGTYINSELSTFYNRQDINEFESKKYKYHILKCGGKYKDVESHRENDIINSLTLQPEDLIDFKLVDLHIDFNPFEGSVNDRGAYKNKSYVAYKSYVPWLRSVGFRTWAKDSAHAASTAADLLLKD
jgi:predicted RNase H-related nuclease YkuK (DUF458 family)